MTGDHCVFDFRGISDDDFQLNPGISDEGCLTKQDEGNNERNDN